MCGKGIDDGSEWITSWVSKKSRNGKALPPNNPHVKAYMAQQEAETQATADAEKIAALEAQLEAFKNGMGPQTEISPTFGLPPEAGTIAGQLDLIA